MKLRRLRITNSLILTSADLVKLVDSYIGTDLYGSQFVQYCLDALCAGAKEIPDSVLGAKAYGGTVTAADALTITVTSLLEALQYEVKVTGDDGSETSKGTNGEILCAFIQGLLGEDATVDVTAIYNAMVDIINGLDIQYSVPDWDYMFEVQPDSDTPVKLPQKTIVYLGYNTDWDKETANALNENFDALVDYVLETAGVDIRGLIGGLLSDNVYTNANLNAIVELIVKAIASLDETLRNLVDAALDTDIASWFSMCDIQYNEDGTVASVVCTKDWGVDALTTEAEKKDAFIAGLKEVINPANRLLAWLFLGDDFALFTGSETDENGELTYNDVITVTGGEGYAYGLVPILEALGCKMTSPDAYVTTNENGNTVYNVGDAVEGIIDSVLARVDEIAGKPANEILNLLPNILYFINAEGVKTSVNNLLAPVNAVIEKLSPIIAEDGKDVSIGSLLEEQLGFNISDLTMDTILTLLVDNTGLTMNEQMYDILRTFYIGDIEKFDSANGEDAYRMVYTNEDYQTKADMITIVLSFALDIVNLNGDLLKELIGDENIYNAIVDVLKGFEGKLIYSEPNWAYMYDDEKIEHLENGDDLPERTPIYDLFINDWSLDTATLLENNLAALIDAVMKLIGEEDNALGAMINGALNDNLYSDDVFNSLLETVVNLLMGLDKSLVETVGAIIGADIDAWFDMGTVNAEGKWECNKEWGVTDAESFASTFADVLAPADRIINWLFFGESYKFLTGTTSEKELITVAGGEGYSYTIVPILEALGCTMSSADTYAPEHISTYMPIADVETYKTAAGINTSQAIKDVVLALLGRVDELCNTTSGNTVNEIINMLPNVIYFISADGIKTAVNNLLAPVNAVIGALSPIINSDGSKATLGSLLGDRLPINIENLTWDEVFNLLSGGAIENVNIKFTDSAKELIKNFYIGKIEENANSASGLNHNFRMTIADDHAARRDFIAIVLSVALETLELNDNAETFKQLFGENKYFAIIDLLKGHEGQFEYPDNNWAYMYEGDDALDQLIANGLPARTGENSIVYTQYTNAWNKATADYLNSGLSTIIESIVEAAKGEGNTIGVLLDAALSEKLYTDAILDQLLEAVVKLLAGLDRVLVDTVGAVLEADIGTWFDWCTITYNEDGTVASVECTKDWGIDAKTDNAEKKEQFVNSFAEALAPANRLLDWLFFAKEYNFLNDENGEDLITISGGDGYAFGLVPLLEALGCENVKPASAFVTENGINTSAAVRYVFEALCERLTAICGKDDMGALDVMLDILPNIVYFINADGAKNTVNNLLQPVYYLIETLSPVVGDVNLDELIGFPLSNLTFDAVFDIVNDKVGLYFNPECEEFVKEFYMGKVEQRDSANGRKYFYMTYSDTETRRDMITILLSLVLDTMKVDSNEAILTKWFGEDVYKTIKNILGLSAAKDMQDFSWYYTEYANTDESFSAIESSGRYTSTYNEYWTKEKAQYVVENLPALIGNVLCLAGIESDGMKLDSLEHLLDSVIQSNLYTQANADAILNMLKDALAQITGLEPYGEYIAEALKNAVDLDLHAWDNMTVEVVDGDRESFTNALTTIIAPAAPLLKLLLTGESISLFLDINGLDAVTIPGSLGYAYGIIPLLEALDCEGILTPDEFKSVLDSDVNAALKAVVDPVFDKIEAIEANPVDQIFSLLPGVVYFINSNGLDTCFKNLVNSVDTVLAAIEPATGKGSLEDLMGFDLSTYDFDWIVDTALNAVKESTGYDLTPFVMDAIAELTVGKVVTYESKNGETYYTMEYASELQKADMLTIALRILIDFATMDENIDKIEALIKDYIPDEENYNSVCSVLEMLADSVSKDPGMGQALYIFYYIFLGVNEGAEVGDDVYHDVNNSWQFILRMLTESSDPFLRGMGNSLKGILNKYFDGIFDDEGLASNGFVEFFKKIAEFFNRIIEFFKNLFSKG